MELIVFWFSLSFLFLFIPATSCSPLTTYDDDTAAESIDEDTLTLEERNVNDTNSFQRSCGHTKTLCPEGIANIVAGGVLFGFLGCFACAMWQWEVQTDRKARIRIALARNKEIDIQLEAARLAQQQQAPPPAPPLGEEEEYKTTGRETDKTSLISVGGGGGGDEEIIDHTLTSNEMTTISHDN